MKTYYILLLMSILVWLTAIILISFEIVDKAFSIHANLKLLMHFATVCISAIAIILASRKKQVIEYPFDNDYNDGIPLGPFFNHYSKLAMIPFIITILAILVLYVIGFNDDNTLPIFWMFFTSISILIFSRLKDFS